MIRYLDHLQNSHVEALKALAKSNDSIGVRLAVIEVLTELGAKGRVPLPILYGLLKDSNPQIQYGVLSSLAKLEAKSITLLPIVAPYLSADNRDLRIAALRSMRSLEDFHGEYVNDVAILLDDKDSNVRAEAMRSLIDYREHARRVLPRLVMGLASEDQGVRNATISELLRLVESSEEQALMYKRHLMLISHDINQTKDFSSAFQVQLDMRRETPCEDVFTELLKSEASKLAESE